MDDCMRFMIEKKSVCDKYNSKIKKAKLTNSNQGIIQSL